MFPDPTIKWRPYPSVMDGMKAPPFVFDRGLWRGVLHLIVFECRPGTRAYGVEIACEAYAAFEEMIYSVSEHGDAGGMYREDVYIKEAQSSKLLDAVRAAQPVRGEFRHFLFVGGDYCYETVGPSEPILRAFPSEEAAYAWKPES